MISHAQNKPNGQFCLPHESKAIINFMSGLSIRKIPGVGRVNERLLESVGIKVRHLSNIWNDYTHPR